MEIFAKRLRELREERHLSRETAAAAVGIVPRTYQRYEKDERDATGPVLVALADFYDVSTDYLLGRSDQRK